jgi:hypothetical protein
MKISLSGVLERAAERCETARDWQTKHLAHGLRDLHQHLRCVKTDPSRLAEFFETWVVEPIEESDTDETSHG